MLKRILIPLEDSSYNLSVIKYACFIAKSQNAEVTAGIYFDAKDAVKPQGVKIETGILWYEENKSEIISRAENIRKNLVELFENECKKANVEYSILPEIGEDFEKLLQKSKFYDLIIIGFQSNFGHEHKKASSNYLQKILDMGVTPVFVVPKVFKPIKNIFIAYDSSVSATKALQRFAHIAALSNFNIKVFISSEDIRFGEECVTEAKNYLRAYGAKNILVEWTQRDISELLKFSFIDEYDTIVLGLHSRKRIIDFFIGSFTKLLIDKADKSLFIGI